MSAETLELDRLRRLVEEAPQVVESSPKITGPEMITVYVSFGNSDDTLSQRRWSDFVRAVLALTASAGQRHGVWFSAPDSMYQNACICVEMPASQRDRTRRYLADIAAAFEQEAITWAEATTTFVTPPGAGHNPHTWGGDRG